MVLALSLNAATLAGADRLPEAFAVEILAQAALLLLPQEAKGEGYLAGIEEARLLAPLAPGMRLRVRVRLIARYAGVIKIAGEIEGETSRVAEAKLILTLGR